MPCNTLGRIPRLCGTENNFGTNDRECGTKFFGDSSNNKKSIPQNIPTHRQCMFLKQARCRCDF